MNEQRDDRLGAELRHLDVPDHQDGFWDELGARLEGADPIVHLDDRRPLRRRLFASSLAAAAAVTVVIFGVSALTDDNDREFTAAQRSEGPTGAPAAARPYEVRYSRTQPDFGTQTFRLLAAPDGSFRATDDAGVTDRGYDAGSARYVELQNLDGNHDTPSGYVVSDLPPGGPDQTVWSGLTEGRVASVVVSLQRSEDPRVTVAQNADTGRAVWRYEGALKSPGSPGPTIRDAVVEIDQTTGAVLYYRATENGSEVEVLKATAFDEETDDPADFVPEVPPGVFASSTSAGFRPLALEKTALLAPYEVLAPTFVPDGFELDSVAYSDVGPVVTEGVKPAADVAVLHYRSGFSAFTVTLRPAPRRSTDPFSREGLALKGMPVEFPLSGRPALEGEVVIDPMIAPHLWGVTGDIVVTVDGALAEKELALVAGSLEPVQLRPPIPQPAPAGDDPQVIVAVEEGRIARYDAGTGSRQAFLTEATPGGGDSEPQLVGDQVFFVRGAGACSSGVWKVSLAGGKPTVVVPAGKTAAHSIAVSADGSRLAWLDDVCEGPVGTEPSLRVLDLVTGKGASWAAGSHPQIDGRPAWSPEGRRLAYQLRSSSENMARQVEVLDLSDFDHPKTDTIPPLPCPSWVPALPNFLPDGTLTVVTCLSESGEDVAVVSRIDGAERRPLVEVFRVEGNIGRLGAYPTTALDFTANGTHALYEMSDSEGNATVWRWDAGSRPRRFPIEGGFPNW